MEEIKLKAEKRELLGKKVKSLRENGQIPAVMYGRKTEPVSLSLDRKEFLKVAKEASESTLIDLDFEGKDDTKALIRNIQRHPVSDEIIHVDLYKVDMSQEIETEIPLEFIGTSAAVEELEGNLITNKDSIKVKCLPNKLVSEIQIDLSALKTFEDLIHVKDINVPEGIEVLDDNEDVVAQVTAPLSEEELAAMEAEATPAADAEKAQIENMEAEAAAAQQAKAEEAESTETEASEKPAEKEEDK